MGWTHSLEHCRRAGPAGAPQYGAHMYPTFRAGTAASSGLPTQAPRVGQTVTYSNVLLFAKV